MNSWCARALMPRVLAQAQQHLSQPRARTLLNSASFGSDLQQRASAPLSSPLLSPRSSGVGPLPAGCAPSSSSPQASRSAGPRLSPPLASAPQASRHHSASSSPLSSLSGSFAAFFAAPSPLFSARPQAPPSRSFLCADAPPSVMEAFQKEKMLEVLRHVPLPVVVVTAAAPASAVPAAPGQAEANGTAAANGDAEGGEDDDPVLRGITCSSFCSISMAPPLVSVCVFSNSHFLDLVNNSELFAVHLLHEGNKTIAGKFAGKNPDLNKATFGEFVGSDWELHRPGGEGSTSVVPLIKDTQAIMVCKRVDVHEYGDHKLLVGEVISQCSKGGDPILYMNRDFWKLGQTI